jgi:putative transposase
VKPAAKAELVAGVTRERDVSERRACRAFEWSRTSIHYRHKRRPDAHYQPLLQRFAEEHPRFGYCCLHAMLRRNGTRLSRARVLRMCVASGLTVRRKRKTRVEREIELNPMRAAVRPNEGWALEFTSEQLVSGERFRILTIIDEYSREIVLCVARRSFKAVAAVALLARACELRGAKPSWLRSDNGTEFVADAAQDYLRDEGIEHERSRPGKPTDNARVESFHGRFRDELLNRTLFESIQHTQHLLDDFTRYYNDLCPHFSLKYFMPAEFSAIQPAVHSELAPVS